MAYTTIDDPSEYFNIILYSGDGSSSQSITGIGFQPDFSWIKERTSTSGHHLFNSNVGYDKALFSHATTAESDQAMAVASDGYTLGSSGGFNENSQTYVGWNWKANGGTTSSNSDGSITSTVQANTTAGFSIITYTGTGSNATIGHGLGVTPDWVIVKSRSEAQNWEVLHTSLGAVSNQDISLNETTGAQSPNGSVRWNSLPTSSVINLAGGNTTNKSSVTFVAYAFAEIQGYSKFGSYTGNGSEDGPFVYLGFKPRWILFKNAGANEEWVLQDTTRNPNNPVTKNIRVDSNIAEADASALDIDFLSNGFKNRSNNAQLNSNGVAYIYMAFAEHPFVSSEGVPVTAR